jgi:hypothetical protein
MRRHGPARRVAGAIVRLYPRAWRERYEQEMLALLEARPTRTRDVVSLVVGCTREWACSRLGRTRSTMAGFGRLAAASVLVGTVAFLVGSVVTIVAPAPWRSWFRLGILASLAVPLRVMVLGRRSREPFNAARWEVIRCNPSGTRTWRVVMFMAAVLLAAADAPRYWMTQAMFNPGFWAIAISFSLFDQYAAPPWLLQTRADVPTEPSGTGPSSPGPRT